jgi:uncharacterized delta-60 repeat protein
MTTRISELTPLLCLLLGSALSLAVPADFDYTFGQQGMVTTAVGPAGDYAREVVLYEGGRIVTAGIAHNDNGDDFAVVRHLADGTLDTTFNGTGKVTVDFGTDLDVCLSVAIQADGKIVLSGYSRGQGEPRTWQSPG